MEQLSRQLSLERAQVDCPQPKQLASVMPSSGKGKGKRLRDWEVAETSALLECVNLPEFRHQKRNQSYMKWDAIAEDTRRRLVTAGCAITDCAITGKRCKERMKTLKGYYQQVQSKQKKGGVTEDEWHKSNGLALDWWHTAIGNFRGPREGKPTKDERKAPEHHIVSIDLPHALLNCENRQRTCEVQTQQCGLDPNVTTNCPSSLHIPMVDGRAEPIQTMGGEKRRKSEVDKQRFAQQFKSLNNLQRSTLLDLYVAANMNSNGIFGPFNGDESLSDLCTKLSIVQNRRELSIYEDVIALEKKGLVMWINNEVLLESTYIDDERLLVHKRFFEKVMQRHPIYNTYHHLHEGPMVTFEARFAPPGITMLTLNKCTELEVVDLSGFEKLRVLDINDCPKLHKVIGCEDCFIGLRLLEIYDCPSYDGYSSFRIFPYLQEFYYYPWNYGLKDDYQHGVRGGELDVSGCVYLRRLFISYDDTLSCIRGLEGLHSLIKLDLQRCRGVQNLPNIGHMKHLTHLNVSYTAVEEIKGIEKLWSLKHLDCDSSKLKILGDLNHLPHLKVVDVHGCPVTKDPSSPFFGKGRVEFNHKTEDVDVSDVSETEQDVSCEGS